MRNSIFLGAISILFLASCGMGGGPSKKDQATIDSLQNIINGDKDNINSYLAEMNVIYDRLEEIKRNEGIISDYSDTDGDLDDDKRDKIQESINVIQQLMNESRDKIATLNKRLKDSKNNNVQLKELIDNLNQEIEDKNREIEDLKDQLASLNIQVDELTQSVDSLENVNEGNQQTISDQDKELNTVYYCMGSFKELVNNQVLDKGGVFVAKAASTLSDDLNLDYFTKTDKRKISEIPVGSKKVTLKTSHPANSYTLVKDGKIITKLVIDDQEDFWRNSKYCVIMLN